ncbi:MAG: hypothetical protein KC983_10215 [Phycisphaerales bacterium]|nr:hypothetical protein [Phycisphaerales bacterium]
MIKPTHSLLLLAATALLGLPGTAMAGTIEPGEYTLHNHPDGAAASPYYGLRLDELFDFNPDSHDIMTFDFDAEGAHMTMSYDGSSLVISGRAFGGLDVGGAYSDVEGQTSWVTINFTYSKIEPVAGDDDLDTVPDNYSNTGSIVWENTGEVIGLWDTAGDHAYTLRLGDEDDDNGHRGFAGISGWGWLDHGAPGTHVASSDWLFTAQPVPVPAALFAGIAGLAGIPVTRRLRRLKRRTG